MRLVIEAESRSEGMTLAELAAVVDRARASGADPAQPVVIQPCRMGRRIRLAVVEAPLGGLLGSTDDPGEVLDAAAREGHGQLGGSLAMKRRPMSDREALDVERDQL